MRTVAILPVKSLGAAKQRLRPGVGEAERAALAEAMACDVIDVLCAHPGLEEVIVVTAEPAVAAHARACGARVEDDPEEAGQSPAAARGIEAARGAERVLLVPGDCPALADADLETLLAARAPVVIVPDRHGTGTNALLLAPPTAIAPAFGPGSCARHQRLAAEASVRAALLALPSLAHDVDTPADLAALDTASVGARTRRRLPRAAA